MILGKAIDRDRGQSVERRWRGGLGDSERRFSFDQLAIRRYTLDESAISEIPRDIEINR